MITLTYNQKLNAAIATFPYDPELVQLVKSIGAKAEYESGKFKMWQIELTEEFESKLDELESDSRFEIDPMIKAAIETARDWRQENYFLSGAESLSFRMSIHPVIDESIKDYQRAGVWYISRNARGVLIGDEMGLGKTLTSLAAVEYMKDSPVLIVCPAVVKFNWRNEIIKWLPNRSVYTFGAAGKENFRDDLQYYVINYDILEKYWKELTSIKFKAIICDESHYLKNYKAARTLRVAELAKTIPHKILMSGTPMLNRPQEIISQLQIINRLDEFGGFWRFANYYCNAYKSRFGWDLSGAAHMDELNRQLRETCYIRREKKAVLFDLPEKTRVDFWIKSDNMPEYRKAESELIKFLEESARLEKDFIKSLEGMSEEENKKAIADYRMDKAQKAKRAEAIVKMNVLSQMAAAGKLAAARAWINNYFEENPNKKLVVFAWHKFIIEELQKEYKCSVITGEVESEDRAEYVKEFQENPDVKIIVCNIQAGGVGITLTAADSSLFLEQGWNPGTMEQAEDRIHRIGQTNPVTIYYMLADETIDRGKWKMIEEKRLNVKDGVDGFEKMREWFLRGEK